MVPSPRTRMPPSFQPPQITPRVRVLIIVLSAAVVLRLLRLDDLSLWADEGVTWWNATHGSWKDAVFAESNHPPVWWLVTRAWAGTAISFAGTRAVRSNVAL